MLIASRVRLLVAGLPGPANWTWWVKFLIVQTGNYKTFLQHCLDNATKIAHHRQDNTPYVRALSWKLTAQRYRRTLTNLYLCLLIKYQLLKLISAPYGYLDCLVLGRFRFIGRISMISGSIASVIVVNSLANRCAVHLLVPKFKFYALEFLMLSHDEVRSIELAATSSTPASRQTSSSANSEETHQISQSNCMNSCEANGKICACHRVGWSAITHLQSPFDVDKETWILRPNRTSECWLQLELWTKFLIYYAVFALVCAITMTYWIFLGSLLTNFGFELAYPLCAAWLRDVQVNRNQSTRFNYLHTYQPAPRVLAYEIPIYKLPIRVPLDTRDLPQLTWYTILRVSVDIIENHIIYLDNIILFFNLSYILAINSIDVVHNATAIRARLLKLLYKLEERRVERCIEQAVARTGCYLGFSERAQPDGGVCRGTRHQMAPPLSGDGIVYQRDKIISTEWISDSNRRLFSTFKCARNIETVDKLNDEPLKEEITELQAILVDHFYTITRGNNLFISFMLGCMGLFWLLYTVAVCVWMSSVRSRVIELEFVLTEAGVTLFCLVLMIGAAHVRSHNLKLHKLITRAMALDPNGMLTKQRWMTVLKYYHPKPFHCFTIFGSTEISLLLGLQIISWILSVFIVLANFFYATRFA